MKINRINWVWLICICLILLNRQEAISLTISFKYKVPMMMEYKVMGDRKINYTYSAGFYGAWRIGYEDNTIFTDTNTILPLNRQIIYTNKYYQSLQNGIATSNVTQLRSLYNSFVGGIIGGVGANIQLSSQIYLDSKLMFDYSISNPENLSYKDAKPARFTYAGTRIDSHLINYGLQVSLRYQFKKMY